MAEARYDGVADFYMAGWQDSYDDTASRAFLNVLGPVENSKILDVACGHGRLTREIARRGALVTGLDVSARLISAARRLEEAAPLGVQYLRGDVSAVADLPAEQFDTVTCCFGLSDSDNLDGAVEGVSTAARLGGRFVFSILHPCFPGAGEVSGAWPSHGSYYEEGWWLADDAASTLRRQVGANHRMVSTYLRVLRRYGFCVDVVEEPAADSAWASAHADAARYPLYLVVGCVKNNTA